MELLDLASEDSRVFAAFGDALKLPADTDRERATRDAAKREALVEGARVQLAVLERAAEVAEMAEQVSALAPPSTLGDAATAIFLAAAAARSAYWSVRSDLGKSHDEASLLLSRAEAAERRSNELLAERLR